MATRRLKLYNAHTSATMLAQYLGSAGDVVVFHTTVVLDGITTLANLRLGLCRSTPLQALSAFSALITSVALSKPVVRRATAAGVANLVLWTNTLSAGQTLQCTVEVIA